MPTKKKATVEVPVDFVKQAYKAACSEWKEKIKKAAPGAFGREPYSFGKSITLDLQDRDEAPLYIANGHAPEDLRGKCLALHNNWEMKTRKHEGRLILIFTEKES